MVAPVARPSLCGLETVRTEERRMSRARTMVLASMAAALVVAASPRAEAVDCARRLVAGGDHIPAGHEAEEDDPYPNHPPDDHLSTRESLCNYDIGVNQTTPST